MSTGHRTALLTTTELYHLDQACQLINRAFKGGPPYLVGSAGTGNDGSPYRDVDVRLMLDDDEFAAACPTRERWELLCLSISGYLSQRAGLKIDFQIQRLREANERFSGPRNPLGLIHLDGTPGRVFAGGGDGTAAWGTPPPQADA